VRGVGRVSTRAVLYLILVVQAIVSLYPIVLMVLTSFKSNNEIFTHPYSLPVSWALRNYAAILTQSSYLRYYANSVLVTAASIALILVLSLLPSYVIAKLRFKGRSLVYFYLLAGMMIPLKLGTLNVVRTMSRLSLTDSLYALILVYAAIGIPYGVLIFTGFIREIPEELSNAARIDGASDYGIFLRIILPNLRPAIAATAIINTLPIWNDFWFPLILISSDAKKTFPLATANLFGQYQTDFGLVFAALSMASLPMILVYLAISKQYLKGIEAGALKG
jgi:raffinose/stachyose/melibiose transport system permease protein